MEDPKAKTFNVQRRVHIMNSTRVFFLLISFGNDISAAGMQVNEFLKILEIQRKAYDTDNILVTMGGDFNYQDANMWFKNLDKLIKYR